MKYSIIIPCYNEEQNIEHLESTITAVAHPFDIEWIFVENGSTDCTRDALKNKFEKKDSSIYKIVYIDKNLGYGYGLKQGISAATGDYIGWLHADLQVSPKYMLEFIQIASQSNEKVFLKGRRTKRSLIENFFTCGMSFVASFILKKWIHDIGAIPVLFNRDLLQHLTNIPDDFSIETYVYYIARKNNYMIVRKRVIMRNRKNGVSSWNNGLKSRIALSKSLFSGIKKIKKQEKTVQMYKKN